MLQKADGQRLMGRPAQLNGPGLKPLAVFGVAVTLIAGAWVATALLSSDEQGPSGQPNDASSSAPSDAEIASEFNRLQNLALQSARTRDVSLLKLAMDPSGSMYSRAKGAIAELRANEVFDRTRVKTIDVEILSKSEDSARIREVARLAPCFVSEAGDNVTEKNSHIERTAIWTLSRSDSGWAIERAQIVDQHTLSTEASCG